MSTHIYIPDDFGRTCPITAPYRLMRVKPVDTVLAGDPPVAQPLGLWVGGTQPMAYDSYQLLAAYWDPAEAWWTAQVPISGGVDGTGTGLLNGLAAMSDREVYLAADTGRIWRIDPQAIEPDAHIINEYVLPLEPYSNQHPTIAGGSDTGGLIFFTDSENNGAHLNEARYGHDPSGADLHYVTITSPALPDYRYTVNTESAIIGGQLFTSLTEFATETTAGGGFSRLYQASPPSPIAGPELLGWANTRLRLAGLSSLNVFALLCLEYGTEPGELYRNVGGGVGPPTWNPVTIPTGAPGYIYCWRGVGVGATPITHEPDAWLCGVRIGDGDDCDPCVAHLNPLTGIWEVTVLALNYFTRGIDGDGLQDIYVIAPDDIWAVGSVCSDSETGTCHSLVVHYDGLRWTERNIPGF